ncbi:MAG: plasmid mobilization relaxosome protein MobC [Balneolaceae bacterium]|nr:plasmid mobilization relaxosome protein MobC [Balneolaceae bacterium]
MSKQPNRGKRDRSVQFWCDSSEFNFIKKQAELAGISRGNYCRQVVLGHRPQTTQLTNGNITRMEVKKLHKQLRAIGTNLNQLAKQANTTQTAPHLEKIESGIEEFSRLNQVILEVLR